MVLSSKVGRSASNVRATSPSTDGAPSLVALAESVIIKSGEDLSQKEISRQENRRENESQQKMALEFTLNDVEDDDLVRETAVAA